MPPSTHSCAGTQSFRGDGGLRGEYLENLPSDLAKFVRQDLILETPTGSVLKPGSRSTVTEISALNRPYVLKLYKQLSLRRRLRYAFTQTRAMQSWRMANTMAQAGIPIARPLAILEWFRFGIPTHSSLLMEKIDGPSLTEFATAADSESLTEIAIRLRDIFSLMHNHSITHGDLKADNILINENRQPHFIDLDAALQHKGSSSYAKHHQKDKARFMKNWQTQPEMAQVFSDVFDKT